MGVEARHPSQECDLEQTKIGPAPTPSVLLYSTARVAARRTLGTVFDVRKNAEGDEIAECFRGLPVMEGWMPDVDFEQRLSTQGPLSYYAHHVRERQAECGTHLIVCFPKMKDPERGYIDDPRAGRATLLQQAGIPSLEVITQRKVVDTFTVLRRPHGSKSLAFLKEQTFYPDLTDTHVLKLHAEPEQMRSLLQQERFGFAEETVDALLSLWEGHQELFLPDIALALTSYHFRRRIDAYRVREQLKRQQFPDPLVRTFLQSCGYTGVEDFLARFPVISLPSGQGKTEHEDACKQMKENANAPSAAFMTTWKRAISRLLLGFDAHAARELLQRQCWDADVPIILHDLNLLVVPSIGKDEPVLIVADLRSEDIEITD